MKSYEEEVDEAEVGDGGPAGDEFIHELDDELFLLEEVNREAHLRNVN